MINCFCIIVDRGKAFTPYFQPEPLSEILPFTNLLLAASSVWTCAESEFRLCWIKFCSSDNHYTTEPLNTWPKFFISLSVSISLSLAISHGRISPNLRAGGWGLRKKIKGLTKYLGKNIVIGCESPNSYLWQICHKNRNRMNSENLSILFFLALIQLKALDYKAEMNRF